MQEFVKNLPNPLILGTLVGIFLCVYRNNRTSRVRFWIVAWSLVFLHFLIPIFNLQPGQFGSLIEAFNAITLQVAGIAFIFSLAPKRMTEFSCWVSFSALSVPVVIYSVIWSYQSTHKLPEAICLALITFGGAGAYQYFCIDRDIYDNFIQLGMISAGVGAIYTLYRGDSLSPYYTIAMVSYALAAVFLIRHYWRYSPGVLVTGAGLLAWSTVWGVAAYFTPIMERIGTAGAELWNVPKFIVAFGMILTLLEDESLSAQLARDREHALIRQVERFAEITSQLLGAVEVPPFCAKIANVITEEGNFRRVVVLLADGSHHVQLAGHSGLSAEALAHVRSVATGMTVEDINHLCETSPKVGKNSYRMAAGHASRLMPSSNQPSANSSRQQGDEFLVPLQSRRGQVVGCFFLDQPKELDRITPGELIKIELLAADLAVAVDRTSMQNQLVQREKLVGIGQLVSGVAHELNNPLTAVLGYTELMGDYALQPEVARDLSIVRREANRMKRIIENLLRFSRQSRTETTSTDLSAVLQDVLTLREYDLNGKGIKLSTALPEQLPVISIDQSQLKIVLSNLIGNAIDAVQDSPRKQIEIAARSLGEKVLLNITDSGPGFADLTRIFDPFFTTKSPGRGTGLGLSICYGIMRQHGGEIYATNVHPSGACVSLELPVSMALASQVAEVVN
jgi:signal transduction histidine kinase/lipoprotein signal peptidase